MKILQKLTQFIIFTLVFLTGTVFAQDRYAVLAYHSVVDDTASKEEKYYFPQTISTNLLISHFNWLKDNGYNVVSWQQIIDAENGKGTLPDHAVLLSFDDGYATMYNVIYPILKAYNYPAVFAPVSSWLNTPVTKKIPYANTYLPRSVFVTWEQVSEMEKSGLVEIASHTHDSHHGVRANPAGSQLPAVISPEYKNNKYETKAEYRNRLVRDFTLSSQSIQREVGKKPRIMVWPYGQFNNTAVDVAREVGMSHHFALGEKLINKVGDKYIGRLLIDTETGFSTIKHYLDGVSDEVKMPRVVRIKLDDIYNVDKKQQAKNLDVLIERIYRYGITTVYLQAYSDADGDGVADALYFPNSYLPIRDDIFSQISWQLRTRAEVKVYAWMPILAFDLRNSVKDAEYMVNSRTNQPRLSPYSRKNIEMIKSIYNDLSFHAKFDGILFSDDAFLSDFEGMSSHGNQSAVNFATKQKTDDLIKVTDQLVEGVKPYFLFGTNALRTARNIYASVITEPKAEALFAQNLSVLSKHYDTTVIMAMPYTEHEQDISEREAKAWFETLINNVKAQVPLDKVLFEFQTVNGHTQKSIPESELISWIQLLQKHNIYSYGYYPDNFLKDQPSIQQMRPYMSVNTKAGKP
ncbi:poly-beta-1,6-N-acetyl-D-glucosamine N-deacetylase PgaB [Aggregatibacter aphrophilus]|jgi:poly-beta-1,6-N-acetyl-D-glucosamine N-deacetylase pgaB|uniref:poly-beta-1,6-N-acetyl-D-glucosamine N-deacetylase PgaB n=1 Tax=Aggregatibacter kilianii TaxID=2025884 RepID=UPI000DAE2085|nr:poly-beta-1,6-N-acetyl-D-glucosamine N-deacetylase PgaB [Aggregatibacter kilianii]RDF00468.1 poly-beta-1,6-N-acetyl-D-glucosamine N-deacetylase PgaB [Aggregatibacter aphrophilus]